MDHTDPVDKDTSFNGIVDVGFSTAIKEDVSNISSSNRNEEKVKIDKNFDLIEPLAPSDFHMVYVDTISYYPI